jgi:hypothetical protein
VGRSVWDTLAWDAGSRRKRCGDVAGHGELGSFDGNSPRSDRKETGPVLCDGEHCWSVEEVVGVSGLVYQTPKSSASRAAMSLVFPRGAVRTGVYELGSAALTDYSLR